ncbi:hypothetical protein N1851_020023 [Merluccius polli]|uniref:Uncharacterized protein n=1 Tax=Merluccius polli TaxID=89951 RepID=A0AA47ML47_MERPO|nr:hypothetical protein N1851_020023 [Merluccius polli]
MPQQGACTRWKQALERKVSWAELWKESHCIKFLIQAVYDILLRPSNLHIWGKIKLPSVSEERDPGAYSQLLLESPGGGALLLAL